MTSIALYTIPEVCARLRVSRSTIYNLIRAGHLQSISIGASRRIRADSVEALIAGGRA